MDVGYVTGPGYRFWNDKRRRLELIGQAGLERSYFRPDDINTLFIIGLFNDRIINYPLLGLGWDYRQPVALWSEQLELFSKGGYKRYLDQPSPYFTREQAVQGSLGMRYYFNDHLRLSWSSELDWEDNRINIPGLELNNGREWRHLLTLGASF